MAGNAPLSAWRERLRNHVKVYFVSVEIYLSTISFTMESIYDLSCMRDIETTLNNLIIVSPTYSVTAHGQLDNI